ncbi:hypothetical protein DFJ73DRAFT_764899 [Zopfochytrium polystomum]|nr:hypothetical protein DFJ73DRAFT_764899 [Zopfochytrium polystomum]
MDNLNHPSPDGRRAYLGIPATARDATTVLRFNDPQTCDVLVRILPSRRLSGNDANAATKILNQVSGRDNSQVSTSAFDKVLKMLIQKQPKNANLFRKLASDATKSWKDKWSKLATTKSAKTTATKQGAKRQRTPKKGLTKPTKQAKMTATKQGAKSTTPKKGLTKPTKQAKTTEAKKGPNSPLKARVAAGRVKGGKK